MTAVLFPAFAVIPAVKSKKQSQFLSKIAKRWKILEKNAKKYV